MQNLRLISRGEVKQASDGRSYFPATFSSGFGQKQITVNMWQIFKKDKAGNNTEEKVWERGGPAEADAAINSGEPILGEKVTRAVEAYTIGEGEKLQTVRTYTTLVFADQKVEAVFAAANHPIVDEVTGDLLTPKVRKAVLATETKEEIGSKSTVEAAAKA